jgi:hypothetical protein
LEVTVVSDADVLIGLGRNEVMSKGSMHWMSGVLKLLKAFNLMLSGPVCSYNDLHTTRML